MDWAIAAMAMRSLPRSACFRVDRELRHERPGVPQSHSLGRVPRRRGPSCGHPSGATINARQARAAFRSASEMQVRPEGVHAFANAEAVHRELLRAAVCQHFRLFNAPVGDCSLVWAKRFFRWVMLKPWNEAVSVCRVIRESYLGGHRLAAR